MRRTSCKASVAPVDVIAANEQGRTKMSCFRQNCTDSLSRDAHTYNAGDTAATSHTEPPTQPIMAAVVAPTAPVFNQTLRALHAERMARQSPAEVILPP